MNTKVWNLNPFVPKLGAPSWSAPFLDGTGAAAWKVGKAPPYVSHFNNPAVVGNAMQFSDFVQCIFSGYVSVQSGNSILQYDAAGNPYIGPAAPIAFTAAGIGVTDVAYGVFLADPSNNLVCAQLFDVPFYFNENGDNVQVYLRYPLVTGPGVLV
jgi:hypothetical protein